MTVSLRYMILAGAAALLAPNAALADCAACRGGGLANAPVPGVNGMGSVNVRGPNVAIGGVNVSGPNVGVGGVNTGGGNSGGCNTTPRCGGGGGINVGGPVVTGPTIVTPVVTVPAPTVVVNASGPSVANHINIVTNGGGGGMMIVRGGGGFVGGGFAEGVNGGAFSLAASQSTQTATRTVSRLAAIQAFCVDDRGVPHSASQTFGEKMVDTSYKGEIYRCMAGTKMRAQLGKFENGQAKFDGASTMDCNKGEALYFDGETVTCRTQEAKRPCNERSLLRRYGAGMKVINIKTTETVEVKREEVRTASQVVGMQFDGGVGGGVW
jgi:hypothetical protein